MDTRRDDLLDAGLATLAAAVHVAMAGVVDRFPPAVDASLSFVALPSALAATAAVVLLLTGDRRLLQGAAVYAWLMVVFTLPAFGLGLAWLPTALLLTVAATRPRLDAARGASD